MYEGKTFLLVAVILVATSVTNAGSVLTVNVLDTSNPIEIKDNNNIIIAVAGQNDEQKETCLVTCELGGKLTLVSKPDSLIKKIEEDNFLFAFKDEKLGLAMINLTVGDTLDYQLILFKVPDANITVFGIDSDVVEISKPEPEVEQANLQFPYDANIVPYALKKEQEKAEQLKICPNDLSYFKTETANTKDNLLSASRLTLGNLEKGDVKLLTSKTVVDVNSDITANTVWISDNIYHVLNPIDVNGAMLVIEPGTKVTFAAGTNAGIRVLNGGTLISRGTATNPITYTSDDSETAQQGDYYCPLYITETASLSTEITYSIVEWAYVGIVVLNRDLDTDIENNYFIYCVYGILEYGTEHTDIINNLCYGSYYSGIEVFLESIDEVADSNSIIRIENNTCDYYQNDGIRIHGVNNVNNAGFAFLANNIVSGAYYYGIHLCDPNEVIYAAILNTGYYGNYYNKNWEFNETSPIIVTTTPYQSGTSGYAPICYLDQACDFINAGNVLPEQTSFVGKTTSTSLIPDSNYVDIGFHYPNWNYSNTGSGDSLLADLNDDLQVDFKDFAVVANYWQQSTISNADLDESGFVDYNDLSIFTEQWLQVADPNIEINIYGDSNEGYVDVGISRFTSDTQRVFLLADGKYIGEIFGFAGGYTLIMDVSEFGNQWQQLKVVSIGNSDRITCSNIKNIAFSCPLSYCLISSNYEPNQPLYFSAINSKEEDVSVKVYADCGNLVWSQIYDGNNVLGSIPAGITDQHEIDYISFSLSGRSNGWSITKISDPAEPDMSFDTKALIILPDLRIRLNEFRSTWAVQDALRDRGIKYKKLGGKSANYDDIAWYVATNPIKYMYVNAHGNYQLIKNGVLRTCVKLSDGIAFSIKQSDFINPNNSPTWCQKLDGNLEKTTKSFFSMGFSFLEFAYFDCCYSGRLKINANNQLLEGQTGQIGIFDGPHSDMSLALGMGETSVSRAYQGWYDLVPTRLQLPLLETEYQKWTRLEWEELGDGESLYWALMHVINEQTEFGSDGPVNNYRLKGQGSLFDIELSN